MGDLHEAKQKSTVRLARAAVGDLCQLVARKVDQRPVAGLLLLDRGMPNLNAPGATASNRTV